MIDTKHPEYLSMLSSWRLARALLEGERAVKMRGEALLPRNEGASDAQYERYLKRALFFNAVGRTADGYAGLLFRRAPRARDFDNHLTTDFNLAGDSLLSYARQVVEEVVGVGRCGTLIDFNRENSRAYATLYRAEDIINWRVENVGGRNRLTMVVLFEPQVEPSPENPFAHQLAQQYRVIRLAEGRVTTQVYRVNDGHFQQVGEFVPTRRRKPLRGIPFVFHGPGPEGAPVAKLPLEDLIAANLDHYRLCAAQRSALCYAATPILALAGFDEGKYAAAASNTSGIPSTITSTSWDARAAYVEYSGAGLKSFEEALDRVERFMAALGSRLLEPKKNVGETAEAIELRQSGESSVLGALGLCVSESLSEAMKLMQWWGRDAAAGEREPRITLNTDFNLQGMNPAMLRELVSAWQSEAITKEELTEALRRGEVLPPNRSPIAGDPEA